MIDPLRYWRTGAVAVVMAALGQAGTAAGRGVADERQLVRRQSPYNVAETVLRIEGSARHHGMAVFARCERGARLPGHVAPGSLAQVLVLESSQGGTPVLMGAAPAAMELPLSVIVRVGGDGLAEVLMAQADGWTAMPNALAQDLAELTEVVGDALAG
jgi:uncharacterized protein (DUF302 family)